MAMAGLTHLQHEKHYDSVPTLRRAADVFEHPTDVSGIWCRGGVVGPKMVRRHSSLLPMGGFEADYLDDGPLPLSPTESEQEISQTI